MNQLELPPELSAILNEAYVQVITGQTKSHQDFLEAANVDDIENYVLSVNTGNNAVGEILRSLVGASRGNQSPQQIPQNVGVGGVQAAPLPGAATPPGVFSQPQLVQ